MLRVFIVTGIVLLLAWGGLIVAAARLPAGPLREAVSFLPSFLTMLRRLRKDPRVPRSAKAALLVGVVWVASPIDLLPEFLPVLGPLDDILAVVLIVRFVARRVPREAFLEAWPGDPALLERFLRVAAGRAWAAS